MKATRRCKWSGGIAAAGLFLVAAAGCSGTYSTPGGTTAVTVTVGTTAAAPSRAAARPLGSAVPSTVTEIRVIVSGEGMDNVVQTFPVTNPDLPLTVTLQVPSGPQRTILVVALDPDGVVRYRGSAVIDATGFPLSITIEMSVDPQNPALESWSNRLSMPGYGNFFGVAFGSGTFVAAGSNGTIYTSTDSGATWVQPVPNISDTLYDVVFGNGVFAAVGSHPAVSNAGWINAFYTAPADNAANWTARTSSIATSSPLSGLAFGANLFVCVGDNAVFRSADNGVTWAPAAAVPQVSGLVSVAYGNGRFVAVSETDSADNNVLVSTDGGATWTIHTCPLPVIVGVAFGKGVFLAINYNGVAYVSPDGVTWTEAGTLPPLDDLVQGVAYGGGVFLALTSAQIAYSTDSGATWTTAQDTYSYRDAAWGAGSFVAVGDDLRIEQSAPF